MPLLGVNPGNGLLDIGRNPPEWSCEDECIERVGGGLCGNTGHFITVLVGEVDGTLTFAAERDDDAARPLDMPPGSELRGVPTGCWVDDADGVWVAAPVGPASDRRHCCPAGAISAWLQQAPCPCRRQPPAMP
jgi:hypothetical protein